MKKINLFIIALVAMLGFTFSVKAQNGVALTCDKTTIKIGESANCVVSITADEAISAATVTLSTSQYLDISNVTANSSAGWSASTSGTSASAGLYAFNNATGGTSGQVFSFNVTLNSAASALSEGDSCGQLCISAATFDGNNLTGILQGTGTCFAPTIVEETCVGSDCNPKTGAFVNYAIIGGALVLAGAAVVVARKSSKFFRI